MIECLAKRNRSAIFISGNGSILGRVLDEFDFENETLSLVVSSRLDCPGVKRARRQAVPVTVLNKKIDWDELHRVLEGHRIERIYLAGFMRLLPAHFLQNWLGKIWNIHPSLLPSYPGLNAIESAVRDGAELGVSVHLVDETLDGGALQFQISTGRIVNSTLAKLCVHRDEQILTRKVVKRWLLPSINL